MIFLKIEERCLSNLKLTEIVQKTQRTFEEHFHRLCPLVVLRKPDSIPNLIPSDFSLLSFPYGSEQVCDFFRISKHQSSSVRNLRLRAINYFQWGSCLFMLYVSALSNSLCDFLAGLAGDLVCNPSRVSFSFRSCLALATGRPHSTTLNAEPFYISKVSGGKSSTKKAIRGCKHLRHNHRNRYLLTFPHLREKCF